MNELSERHEQWIAAVNSRDIESYAELVAEDVVWIPPAGHAIVGRQAFREWLEPFFEAYEYEFSTADHRYRAAGDWVAESGAFESRMTPATGGSAMSHVGSYLALWSAMSMGSGASTGMSIRVHCAGTDWNPCLTCGPRA